MHSPFPGMDPYLEHPELWPDVHHRLITAIADLLAPLLRPRYRVAIEKRIYQVNDDALLLVGLPDVAVLAAQQATPAPRLSNGATVPQPMAVTLPIPQTVQEGYLEIRDLQTAQVVTALEVLSPRNKRAGEGRRIYELKRRRVLGSATHLVEVDLLRMSEPMPMLGATSPGTYRILVSRAERRPTADLYPFALCERVPKFALPLKPDDPEPVVDLQEILSDIYERAGYDLAIDYRQACIPALSVEDAAWADGLLRSQNLRL